MPRRNLLVFTASLLVLVLALAGAGWAATGRLPLTGALSTADAPRMAAAAATGPVLANEHEGRAVLTAAGLAPGRTQTGEVTITNSGGPADAFSLIATGAGSNPQLSEVLEMSVIDVTGPAPASVYSGTVAALDAVDLGGLSAGAARRYRFEVTYPSGRPAALDNPLQGATTSISVLWRAVGVDTGTAGGTPAPALTAPATSDPSAGARHRPATASPTRHLPALKIRLTRHKGAIRDGALRARLSASIPARATLSGTITVRGRVTKLRTTRVRLAPNRREIRVIIPRSVRIRGAGKRAVFKLTLKASAGSQHVTVRRTLPTMLPRHYRGR
jgi:hypothetical protein